MNPNSDQKKNLTGDSWVLKELKKIARTTMHDDDYLAFEQDITDLKSRAPQPERPEPHTLAALAEEEFGRFCDFIKKRFGQKYVDKIGGEGWINVVMELLSAPQPESCPDAVSRKRIEAAIRKFKRHTYIADLLRYISNRKQKTWKDSDFNSPPQRTRKKEE